MGRSVTTKIVSTVAGKTGDVSLDVADVSGAAPLASPTLTGIPKAPTAPVGTSTQQLATTEFVSKIAMSAGSVALTNAAPSSESVGAASSVGSSSAAARSDHVHAMPGTATTAASGFMSAADKTKLDGVETGAQVNDVTSVAGRTGAVTLSVSDISGAAPSASPSFTGTPTAPTAVVGTNTTQVATTAFVKAEVANNITSATPAAETVGAAGAVGTSSAAARSDHVHAMPGTATTAASGFMSAADKTKLDGVASGAAALGTSAGSALGTASAGSATTAAKSDHVHPLPTLQALGAAASNHTHDYAASNHTHDYAASNHTHDYADSTHTHSIYAPLASPALTGTPTAPTATVGTNTTQVATTAFVKAEVANNITSSTPTAETVGAAGATGTSSAAARSDHVHAMPGTATTAASGFMSAADKTKLDGVASGAAALGTSAGSALGTASAGSATTAAKSDHVHPYPTAAQVGAAASTHTHTLANISDWPEGISAAELGYLNGVTSAIQTQLNAKAASTHTHDYAASSHTHDYAATSHTHSTYAPLASPALTGTPTAPTATAGTNTTQIATTAFVTKELTIIGGGSYLKYTYSTHGTTTLTIPTSVSDWRNIHMRISLQGAGGGGGGGGSSGAPVRNPTSSGGGGGAGGDQIYTLTSGINAGDVVTITVGLGGAGGAANVTWNGSSVNGSPGNDGGDTTVVFNGMTYISTGGGGGGGGTTQLSDAGSGGAGGSLGGRNGIGGSFSSANGGGGGSSRYGAGGIGGTPVPRTSAGPGGAGSRGSGGGGGAADGANSDIGYAGKGGMGGHGYVVIELYDPNGFALQKQMITANASLADLDYYVKSNLITGVGQRYKGSGSYNKLYLELVDSNTINLVSESYDCACDCSGRC